MNGLYQRTNEMKKLLLIVGLLALVGIGTLGMAEYLYGDVSFLLGLSSGSSSERALQGEDVSSFVERVYAEDDFDAVRGTEVVWKGKVSQLTKIGFHVGKDGSAPNVLDGGIYYYGDVRFSGPVPSWVELGQEIAVKGQLTKQAHGRGRMSVVMEQPELVGS